MVTVLIFGLTLRNEIGETEVQLELSEPTSVKKLVEANQDRLAGLLVHMARREVLIAVNKKISTEDSLVKDGDVVKLTYQSMASHDGVRDIPV